jgi:two-component system chemotaxis response regulator CheY
MRVLVVDDAAVMRAVIAAMLRNHGFEPAGEAATGAEAVERFRALRPDAAIVDVVLPDMRGAEAIRAILAVDPNARLFACGSSAQRPLVNEALAAGALGYIVKPLQPQPAAEVLERALASPEDVRERSPNNRE